MMEMFMTIAQGAAMFILTFLVLFAFVLVVEKKNRQDMETYHAANLKYLEKALAENNIKAPKPSKRILNPKAPIEPGKAWCPSKDLDHVMKGKLVDPFD